MRTVDPERHAAQRARILDAAAQEFAANGVDGTSTAAICKRAGIGSGTLFHYFPTKREIFRAVFEEGFQRTAQVCDQALDGRAAAEALELLVDHVATELSNPLTPGLVAAAILEAHRDSEFAQALHNEDQIIGACLVQLLRRLEESRSGMLFSPERTAAWILKLIDGAYLASDGRPDSANVSELKSVIDRFLGAPRPTTKTRAHQIHNAE